jgi:hypothetical protein
VSGCGDVQMYRLLMYCCLGHRSSAVLPPSNSAGMAFLWSQLGFCSKGGVCRPSAAIASL